jgi:Fur family ferric uptake transcriptional regulator
MSGAQHAAKPDPDALRAKLDTYMSKKGLRSTVQRRAITDAFFSGPSHVTIEDVLAESRKIDKRIGYATVYRTLKLFTDCGVAEELHFGDGVSRYELSDGSTEQHHDHLICMSCNKIVEFHDDEIEQLQDAVAERFNFEVVSHKHEVYGLCGDCR